MKVKNQRKRWRFVEDFVNIYVYLRLKRKNLKKKRRQIHCFDPFRTIHHLQAYFFDINAETDNLIFIDNFDF